MDELAAKQVLLDVEIILLITLLLGVFLFAFLKRRRGEWNPHAEFDRYDLVLMLFPALLFLFNPSLEVMVAEKRLEGDDSLPAEPTAAGAFVNNTYFLFVGVMTYGIIEWVRNRSVVHLFGLKQLRLPVIVITSILGGIASMLICAWALGNASQTILDRIFDTLSVQESVEALQNSTSVVQIGLAVLMACVAAPVVEEFLFRGYMYGAVKEATNPVFSAVVIGGLFAVVHGNLPALVPLWALSLILCLAYEWTRCLWVPIGIHAVFNGANILLMLVPPSVE
ncbi:MAG: CPBP family intramembrane glutamic endopeptidase [Verrucomicrobiota bacterium]